MRTLNNTEWGGGGRGRDLASRLLGLFWSKKAGFQISSSRLLGYEKVKRRDTKSRLLDFSGTRW